MIAIWKSKDDSLGYSKPHGPTMRTEAFEQPKICLLQNAERLLEQVRERLGASRHGTYGKCESCGERSSGAARGVALRGPFVPACQQRLESIGSAGILLSHRRRNWVLLRRSAFYPALTKETKWLVRHNSHRRGPGRQPALSRYSHHTAEHRCGIGQLSDWLAVMWSTWLSWPFLC